MPDEITFVGHDKDDDPVWRLPDGNLLAADNLEEALSLWNTRVRRNGCGHQEWLYLDMWGPITKEPING